MTRIALITARQQAASFGVAVATTLALMGGLTGLAQACQAEATQTAAASQAPVQTVQTVQTVVVVGKRAAA